MRAMSGDLQGNIWLP